VKPRLFEPGKINHALDAHKEVWGTTGKLPKGGVWRKLGAALLLSSLSKTDPK
jgi:hypothetical protein